ncbi:MAG: hypothetical protein ABL903_08605 [Methylococcales bacterium]
MKNQQNMAISPFAWGEMKFNEVLHIDGVPHLTRQAIGEFLEYAEPRKAISNIVERNPYILEFELSSTVRTVDGKNREVFLYSPVGFLLIAMSSDQPRAVLMKVAIAKFVAHYSKPNQNATDELSPGELLVKECKLIDFLKSKNPQNLQEANKRVIAQTGFDVLADYQWVNQQPALVGQFWDNFWHMNKDEKLNHSRHPETEIAVNLAEFEACCKRHDLKIIKPFELRKILQASLNPKFIRTAGVNSRLESRTIRCWIFSKETGD